MSATTLQQTNLDALPADDVQAFAVAIGNGIRPVAAARLLFPDRPTGYVSATGDLRNYAWNKATAMRCRLRGDIQAATIYETICDRIYDALPDFARMW